MSLNGVRGCKELVNQSGWSTRQVHMLPFKSVYFMILVIPLIVFPALSVAKKYRVVYLL